MPCYEARYPLSTMIALSNVCRGCDHAFGTSTTIPGTLYLRTNTRLCRYLSPVIPSGAANTNGSRCSLNVRQQKPRAPVIFMSYHTMQYRIICCKVISIYRYSETDIISYHVMPVIILSETTTCWGTDWYRVIGCLWYIWYISVSCFFCALIML